MARQRSGIEVRDYIGEWMMGCRRCAEELICIGDVRAVFFESMGHKRCGLRCVLLECVVWWKALVVVVVLCTFQKLYR